MPHVDVQTEIEIERPIEMVAAFAGNPDNVTEWYKNIQSLEWRSSPPLMLGSKLAFVAQFLGRKLEYTYEIVELNLPDHLVMKTSDGPFPMETSYHWVAIEPCRTRMILRNRGNAKGFVGLTAPFMSSMMRRANLLDLKTLKAVLESQPL